MMKYDAVLWDMDGTLLDTLEDLQNSVNDVLRRNRLPERTREQICDAVGNGAARLLERSVPGGRTRPDFDTLMAQFHECYARQCGQTTRIYSGLLPVLQALRAQGAKMAVVSNKPDYGVQALSQQFFPGLLDAAVGERAGVRRKPAPDMVLLAAAQLGVSPERCVYIGDSEVDLATAQNAQMRCISAAWGFRSREFLLQNGAQLLADTPQALLKLLGAEEEA